MKPRFIKLLRVLSVTALLSINALGAAEILPDDPAWRRLPTPSQFTSSPATIVGEHTRFFRYTSNHDEHFYRYSPDGVQWLRIPFGLSGRTGAIGEELRFNSLLRADGTWLHAFGTRLYSGTLPNDWRPVAENRLWLSVQTALLNDRIVCVGVVSADDSKLTVAATKNGDGSWTETLLFDTRFGTYGRLLQVPDGLVFATREGFWSTVDGLTWTYNAVPEPLKAVPHTAILGNGPFMVAYFGTAGSLETGDFRTVSAFVRSEDGLNWSDASGGFLVVHGAKDFFNPWFFKTGFPPVNAPLYLSLNAMEWELFEPRSNLRVVQTEDNESFAMGLFNDGIYILDKAPPLPRSGCLSLDGT